MVLSLPPIPLELKAITPYLQRADELQKNDPVVSYWCTCPRVRALPRPPATRP